MRFFQRGAGLICATCAAIAITAGSATHAGAASNIIHPFDTSRPSAHGLSAAQITWVAGEDEGGPFVSNSVKKIYVKSTRRAERLAKRFNRSPAVKETSAPGK